MNKITLFLTLVSLILVGCSSVEAVVPSPLPPTRVTATERPPDLPPGWSATPEPTETPITEPTPDIVASQYRHIWDIAEVMMRECAGATQLPKELWYPDGVSHSVVADYKMEIHSYASQVYPNLTSNSPTSRNGNRFTSYHGNRILVNNGDYASPFDFLDPAGVKRLFEYRPLYCEGFIVFLEEVPENEDTDGILVGEAWLFYEVGGTEPYVLDGELKEVHSFFPSNP